MFKPDPDFNGIPMTTHREFEKLVARIEATLAPAGAVVKSPDHLPDIFTGETREVDVSVRCKVGSVELLITVECRDRVRTEDVTWIEQLATKQKHVGAARTIAVSSTGFSAPALTAARTHGISTRTIEEITDADIRAWADRLKIVEVDTRCTLGRLGLVYFDSYEVAPELDASSTEKWTKEGWAAEIFVDRTTGATVSLADLIGRATTNSDALQIKADAIQLTIAPKTTAVVSIDPLAVLTRDVPIDGSTIQRTFYLDVESEDVCVGTTQGLLTLRRLTFELTMTSSRKRVPVARVVGYSDEARSIAVVAERDIALGPKRQQFVITEYRPGTDSQTESKKE